MYSQLSDRIFKPKTSLVPTEIVPVVVVEVARYKLTCTIYFHAFLPKAVPFAVTGITSVIGCDARSYPRTMTEYPVSATLLLTTRSPRVKLWAGPHNTSIPIRRSGNSY